MTQCTLTSWSSESSVCFQILGDECTLNDYNVKPGSTVRRPGDPWWPWCVWCGALALHGIEAGSMIEYFNPLVFWYQWEYLHSPAKNLFFCRVSKIGNVNLAKLYRPHVILPNPSLSWFILGKSSPFMAELFRLVKYYNLPRLHVPMRLCSSGQLEHSWNPKTWRDDLGLAQAATRRSFKDDAISPTSSASSPQQLLCIFACFAIASLPYFGRFHS